MKALLSVLLFLAYSNAFCQSFTGLYATDNAILQVRENPAFVVTDDLVQINLASAGITVGGNSFYFKQSSFSFPENNKAVLDVNYFKNYFPGSKSFYAFAEIKGPGASFVKKIKEKYYYFAITTGARYLMNSDNLDNKTFKLLGASPWKDTALYDSLKIHNYSISSQVFSELNLSYGGYIFQSEYYNLIAGATLKILSGIGAAAVNVPNASFFEYENNGIAYYLTGKGTIAFTPYANRWAITNNPFNAFGSSQYNMGAGLDLGLVYYINPNELMHLKKGYLVRFAASITDIGSINYTASNTSGNYIVNNKNVNYQGIQNNKNYTFGTQLFNGYLIDTVLKPAGDINTFTVKLPTALHFDADLRLVDNLFFDFNALLNLRKPSMDYFSSHYVTTFALTPRYMYHGFGLAAPFSYNVNNQGYLGLIVYLGPFFIGSGSGFEMAISNTVSNISIFMGATWRIKPKEAKEKVLLWDN